MGKVTEDLQGPIWYKLFLYTKFKTSTFSELSKIVILKNLKRNRFIPQNVIFRGAPAARRAAKRSPIHI